MKSMKIMELQRYVCAHFGEPGVCDRAEEWRPKPPSVAKELVSGGYRGLHAQLRIKIGARSGGNYRVLMQRCDRKARVGS
jgi:hypothetical protein